VGGGAGGAAGTLASPACICSASHTGDASVPTRPVRHPRPYRMVPIRSLKFTISKRATDFFAHLLIGFGEQSFFQRLPGLRATDAA
jgi:hypothetical protein